VADNRELEEELKHLIVEAVALEDLTAEEIGTEDHLFVDGLGLDSIDALEISMEVEQRYGVVFDEDPEQNQAIFQSVKTLATFILENQPR
jgi:acyl carrier protein